VAPPVPCLLSFPVYMHSKKGDYGAINTKALLKGSDKRTSSPALPAVNRTRTLVSHSNPRNLSANGSQRTHTIISPTYKKASHRESPTPSLKLLLSPDTGRTLKPVLREAIDYRVRLSIERLVGSSLPGEVILFLHPAVFPRPAIPEESGVSADWVLSSL